MVIDPARLYLNGGRPSRCRRAIVMAGSCRVNNENHKISDYCGGMIGSDPRLRAGISCEGDSNGFMPPQ